MEYLIILRLLHIVCAIFWAGSVMYLALFIIPTVKALGPDGGKFMQQLSMTNKMPLVMTLAGTITVVGGILLLERISGGFQADYFGTPHGIVLSIGATFAIIGYFIGLLVNKPTVEKIAKIGALAKGNPTPEQMQELQQLRKKLFSAVNYTALLLLGAAIFMSIARYF